MNLRGENQLKLYWNSEIEQNLTEIQKEFKFAIIIVKIDR